MAGMDSYPLPGHIAVEDPLETEVPMSASEEKGNLGIFQLMEKLEKAADELLGR